MSGSSQILLGLLPGDSLRQLCFKFVSNFLDREEQAKVMANEDKSDENMWVPSDLDSQSEIKEDENGTEMEEDPGNSDGESSSEGELP